MQAMLKTPSRIDPSTLRRCLLAATFCLAVVTTGARGDVSGKTVHSAAQTGKLDLLKTFLREAPDSIRARDPLGQTPLHRAALARDPQPVLQLLIAAGADVTAKDQAGDTPLHVAARTHRAKAVRVLLDAQADINAQNQRGETALHTAALMGVNLKSEAERRAATIKVLLAAGANPALTDADGRTPLHVAVARGRMFAAKTLLAAKEMKTPIAARDHQGRTALHWAAQGNNPDLISLLLDHEAKVNAKDQRGATPLHAAATRFRAGSIKVLLARGADVNALDGGKNTPLLTLARTTHSHHDVDAMVTAAGKLLIEAGADVNHLAADHTSALDHAKKNGYPQLAALLVANGGA
jgi:ankyrin repeat protein